MHIQENLCCVLHFPASCYPCFSLSSLSGFLFPPFFLSFLSLLNHYFGIRKRQIGPGVLLIHISASLFHDLQF